MSKFFRKFTSLENGYRQKFVNYCSMLGVKDWVATEKVHGANFSFIAEPDKTEVGDLRVTPAKRSSTIGANAVGDYDFYGCTDVVEDYADKIRFLNDRLWDAGIIESGDVTITYGELFGDGIQKEVKYGEKDFIAYDIKVIRGAQEFWLEWPIVQSYCLMSDIPTVPELATGTLDDLLAISPEFVTKLGPQTEDNVSEGFVIKQLHKEQLLPHGARACIKVKSEKFKEKKGKDTKAPAAPIVLTEEQEKLYSELSLYVTEARLRNVLSKIGTVNQKQFGMLQGLLIQDAKAEFERDERDEVPIHKDDWKVLKKPFGNLCVNTVRHYWMDILDGEF